MSRSSLRDFLLSSPFIALEKLSCDTFRGSRFSFPVLTIFRSALFSASAQTISVLVFVAVSLCEAFGLGEGGGGCSYFPSLSRPCTAENGPRYYGACSGKTNGSAPRDNYGQAHGTLPAFLYESLLELDSLEVH